MWSQWPYLLSSDHQLSYTCDTFESVVWFYLHKVLLHTLLGIYLYGLISEPQLTWDIVSSHLVLG